MASLWIIVFYYQTRVGADRKEEGIGHSERSDVGYQLAGILPRFRKEKKLFDEYLAFRITGFAITDDVVSVTVRDKTDKKKSHIHRFKSVEAEEIFALMTTIQDDIKGKMAEGYD